MFNLENTVESKHNRVITLCIITQVSRKQVTCDGHFVFEFIKTP